jgi:hypothetical protein
MKISTVLTALLLIGTAVGGDAKPRGMSKDSTEKVPANPGRMGDRVEEEETVPAPPQLPTTSVGVPAIASLPTAALHVSSDDEESSDEVGGESEDEVEVLPKRRDGPFAKNPGRNFDMSPMAEMDLTPMADATVADLSRYRFKYWMDRFFAQHAAGMTAAGMNVLLRMLWFAKEGESFEEMSKELIQRAQRRRYQALQGELDTFIAKQLKRLDNNWNRRELSLVGRYGQWRDMQEEMLRERTMEFTDGRANDWEENVTNGWFEFAGTAAAVSAALNGEDSEEEDDDDDGVERRRKRKATETGGETSSESDDDSEDDRKPPAKRTPRGA